MYYKLDVVPVLVYGHNIYGVPRSKATAEQIELRIWCKSGNSIHTV